MDLTISRPPHVFTTIATSKRRIFFKTYKRGNCKRICPNNQKSTHLLYAGLIERKTSGQNKIKPGFFYGAFGETVCCNCDDIFARAEQTLFHVLEIKRYFSQGHVLTHIFVKPTYLRRIHVAQHII